MASGQQQKKTILVTGAGTGLGKQVTEALLAQGNTKVIAWMHPMEKDHLMAQGILSSTSTSTTSSESSPQQQQQLVQYYGHLHDSSSSLEHMFATEKPTVVAHLEDGSIDPLLYLQGTIRLLNASSKGVTNFVLRSSCAVYNDEGVLAATNSATTMNLLLDEDARVEKPRSIDAAMAKGAELLAYTYHHLYQIPVTALRLFPLYGPGLGFDGSSRDQTYVDTMVDGVLRSLDRVFPYEIINLGSGVAMDQTEWNRLKNQLSSNTAVEQRQQEVPCCANISKAVQLLGYNSHRVPIAEGIQRLDDWLQQTPVDQRVPTTTVNKTPFFATPNQQANKPIPLSWQDQPILEPHTAPKTVLVTGAAGFVGSHVADLLLERGDTVIIVDEVNSYYNTQIKRGNIQLLMNKYQQTSRIRFYEGDICNTTFMEHVFATETALDTICHMAARAGVRPSIEDPLIYLHSNVEGTTKLLQWAQEQKNIRNFVFASSSSVYGGSKSTLFDEDERVDNPISPYAASKKLCELIAYPYRHSLSITALRFFTVYGPRGRPDMAPFKFVDRVSRGQRLQRFGDGSSSRDYTYIDDIADGVVRALDRPYNYQIFNLGKGSGTKLNAFLELVEQNVGKTALIDVLPDQPGDVPYTCANVARAQRLLGYQSTVPFELGISKLVAWYKKAYPDKNAGGSSNTSSIGSSATMTRATSATTQTSSSTASSSTLAYERLESGNNNAASYSVGSSWLQAIIVLQWVCIGGLVFRRVLPSQPQQHKHR